MHMPINYRLKPSFFVSGSEDQTLKLWRVPADPSELHGTDIAATHTERAHDKEICSVTVAPNDKFIASGSMDKTAKVCLFLLKLYYTDLHH